MRLANSDAVVADAGRASYGRMADAFRATLLVHRADIGHPDPEHACAWSCTVVYSVLARWLGLGGDVAAAGEGEWDRVVDDLVATVVAVLAAPAT